MKKYDRPQLTKGSIVVSPQWSKMLWTLEGEEWDEFAAACVGICLDDERYIGVEGFANPKLQDLFERTMIKKADPANGKPGYIGKRRGK